MSPSAQDTIRAGFPSRPGTAQADVFENTRLFHVKQAPRSLRSVQFCRERPGVPTSACFT